MPSAPFRAISWRPRARSQPTCSRSIRERSPASPSRSAFSPPTLGVVDRGDRIVVADVGDDRGGRRLGAGLATPACLLRRVDRAAVLRRALAAGDDRARRRRGHPRQRGPAFVRDDLGHRARTRARARRDRPMRVRRRHGGRARRRAAPALPRRRGRRRQLLLPARAATRRRRPPTRPSLPSGGGAGSGLAGNHARREPEAKVVEA